jgi:hypothetical protein
MKDELRSILRKGDPAAGDPGLTPEEVQAMRRVVLSAVPEPRRRGWPVPAMAAAAALILAALIALGLWQPEKPEEVVVVRPPAVRPPLPLAGEGRGEGSVVQPEKTPPQPSPAAQEREPEKKKPLRRAPEPAPVIIAQAEPPEPPQASTQIQFSTPGGTRVIWVLNPATE